MGIPWELELEQGKYRRTTAAYSKDLPVGEIHAEGVKCTCVLLILANL